MVSNLSCSNLSVIWELLQVADSLKGLVEQLYRMYMQGLGKSRALACVGLTDFKQDLDMCRVKGFGLRHHKLGHGAWSFSKQCVSKQSICLEKSVLVFLGFSFFDTLPYGSWAQTRPVMLMMLASPTWREPLKFHKLYAFQ